MAIRFRLCDAVVKPEEMHVQVFIGMGLDEPLALTGQPVCSIRKLMLYVYRETVPSLKEVSEGSQG
eukprot:6469100-Amphidinium_carterae.1